MPLQSYINITGATQGHITLDAFTADSVGNVYVEGHKDEMPVDAIQHQVSVPTNYQSSQLSGSAIHHPFKISTILNKAIPLCYAAMVTGELLQADLIWYRICSKGKRELFFKTHLTDAVIIDINCKLPHCMDPINSTFTQIIEISFSYRKIVWEHLISSTSGADDWRAPQV